MTKRTLFRAGLLCGTRMTAAEQRVGRFLRAPDGHPEAAPAAAPEPAPAAAPAAPAAAPTDAMAALELEMGDVVLPGSGNDDGDPPAAPAEDGEPGASAPEPKDDPVAELEAAKAREAALQEELRVLKEGKGKEPPVKDGDATPAPVAPEDPAPDPKDYEYGEADSKFIGDTARWSARQEFAQMRAKEQLTTELNTIEDGWKAATTAEDIKAEYPDFDDVVTKGAAEEKWDCSPLMALGIKSSPVGPHVAYELAKNPAESKRIASLIPVEQAFELGRLEGRVAERRAAKKTAPEAPASAPKVASSAPPPPVSRSRGAGGQFSTELGTMQDRMLKEFR